MSLIKGTTQHKTIVDFSGMTSLTKEVILKQLKHTEVRNHILNKDEGSYTYFDNNIKVGMYNIHLILFTHLDEYKSLLKQYAGFSIRVFEKDKEINILKDGRFSYKNFSYEMSVTDLIEFIHHCKRLDNNKAFL